MHQLKMKNESIWGEEKRVFKSLSYLKRFEIEER